MSIWYQTDPHFFHANILKFTDWSGQLIRPDFSTIEEMHQCFLEKHNACVKEGDKVYWLGDIVFKVTPEFIEYFQKFNGSHRVIFGNHDNVKQLVKSGLFQKYFGTWRVFGEQGIVPFCCTHIPIDIGSIRGKFNVHGHIHQNDSPTPYHINICPEVVDYHPTHFEDLQQVMRDRLAAGHDLELNERLR